MTECTSKKLTQSYFSVFVFAAAVYAVTCVPGSLFQDSGMFQYRIWHNDVEGGLGLALAHPLYHFIGIVAKSIPLGEYGYRINLISAICGAITAANIFLLIRFSVGGLIPAIGLGLSWTFWKHSDYKNPIDFVTVQMLDGLLAEKAVYVVTPQKGYCPGSILEDYGFVNSGQVFKIKAASAVNQDTF